MTTPDKMTFEEAREVKLQLEAEADKRSVTLKEFPRLPNGLTPDDVRTTPEYKSAKTEYEQAAAKVRNFNAWFTKKFKREWSDRANRRPPGSPK